MSNRKSATKDSEYPIRSDIGKKIRMLRKKLNLSVPVLANSIGYSPSHLIRIEHGDSEPTPEMIDLLIKSLNLNNKWPNVPPDESLFLDSASFHSDIDSLHVGERLVQFRKERGLLQKEMAALVGISLPNIIAVEYGRRKMTMRFAKKVEDACDVSASWLLYGDELSKDNPCGDKMIEYLRKSPEARKAVKLMMDREDN